MKDALKLSTTEDENCWIVPNLDQSQSDILSSYTKGVLDTMKLKLTVGFQRIFRN
jgi:hypothetical protein